MQPNMNENQTPHDHDELTRMVEPDAPKMPFMKRFISIFSAPTELMQNIKTHPVILAPFLITLIIGILSLIPFNMGITELSLQETDRAMVEMWGTGMIQPDLADIYGDLEDIMATAMNIGMIIGGISTVVFTPWITSFFATLGIFILAKIAKGKATFVQTFSMYMHVYAIMALGMLVSYIIMLSMGRFVDVTTLAPLLMPDGHILQPMYLFLFSIGVFPLWATFIMFIGIKVLNEFSAAKAAVISIVVLLVSAAIPAVMVMLTNMLVAVAQF